MSLARPIYSLLYAYAVYVGPENMKGSAMIDYKVSLINQKKPIGI